MANYYSLFFLLYKDFSIILGHFISPLSYIKTTKMLKLLPGLKIFPHLIIESICLVQEFSSLECLNIWYVFFVLIPFSFGLFYFYLDLFWSLTKKKDNFYLKCHQIKLNDIINYKSWYLYEDSQKNWILLLILMIENKPLLLFDKFINFRILRNKLNLYNY